MSAHRTLRDVGIFTRRNLRRFVRDPYLLLVPAVRAVMFLLVYTYVFGGAIALGTPNVGEYIDFLIPGIVVQTVVFGATVTPTGLIEDFDSGVIYRFRSLPMASSAVLQGRIIADLIRSAGVQSLMLVVGIVIGFQAASWPGFVAGLVVALLFGYAVSWFFAMVGLTIRDTETSQVASTLVVFPFVFASAVFVPTATMPDWLRLFAEHQPVSIVANTVRKLTFPDTPVAGGDTVESLLLRSLLWIGAILVVFGYLGVRQYRRAVT